MQKISTLDNEAKLNDFNEKSEDKISVTSISSNAMVNPLSITPFLNTSMKMTYPQ